MSRKAKTLMLAAIVGAVAGCGMTGFMDAVRAGNTFLAVFCAALWLVMFMLMWRVIRHWRTLKGWN